MSALLNGRFERKQSSLVYDTRRLGEKVRDALADEMVATLAMAAFALAMFFGRQLAEFIFLVSVCFFFYARSAQRKAGLALRMPKTSHEVDPKEISPATHRPSKAAGIVYLGNDADTGEEVWLTDNMARTHMLFMGTTGSGKAQPLHSLIHTPDGWRRMGEIAVGDLVSLPAGGSAAVSGVFPQGRLPIYRVTFADGRSAEACGDHLWEVHHKHWNGKYKPGRSRAGAARPRILTTRQIIEQKSRNKGTFCVPLPDAVELPRQKLPLHPYLLGILLGDGCFTGGNVRLSSDDEDVFSAVEALCPEGIAVTSYGCQHPRDRVLTGPRGRLPGGAYARNPVRAALDGLGLVDVTSERKFVPDVYRNGSIEQRRMLLCGLMDADGFAGVSGGVSFTSVSRQLAEDVQYLVRSLGGIASISEKRPTYTYRGERRSGQLAYNVNIRHPRPESLFTLERKASRVRGYQYADSLRLAIEKVELLGEEEAQCIMVDDKRHLYITNDFVVTHNTEFLVSLVYNALIHASGLIYVDGKADSSLYGKIYSMARSMGREDDVLVINFQTGAKDIYGAQPHKLSNTLNPFAVGSSGMLSELVKGLMATSEKSTWTQQAESFVEALMKPLVFLRDNHGLDLDVNVMRDYFELNKLEDLAWKDGDQYPGLVESGALDGLRAYLLNKPGYKKEKFHDQSETTHEQHGYISMQLGRTFNSLSDTYGYIMKTPLAEIDFVDVFLNRRILVVLLPALEKSPTELTNLGRIVVASLKATMAKGLGSAIEGDWQEIITSKPTNSPSPFMCVLDEYGFYATEGFSVVPGQARSLGFSAIFAGQDLPAFEKASKEEAKSTLANTNTKLCGKLECTETFKYFQSLGGQGLFTRLGRYETDPGALLSTGYKADTNVNVERLDRVDLESLRGQISGEWNLFFGNTKLRVKSFYADPKPVKDLRVNHFIKVARPDPQEVASFMNSTDMFKRAVTAEGGLKSFMDVAGSVADIQDIQHASEMFKEAEPLLAAGMVLAYCAQAEQRRVGAFARLTASNLDGAEGGNAAFDFASQVSGDAHHGPEGEASQQAETAWGPAGTLPWTGLAEPGSAQGRAEQSDADHRRLFNDRDDVDAAGAYSAERPQDEETAAAAGRPGKTQADFVYADEDEQVHNKSSEAELYGDGFDIGDPVPAERAPILVIPQGFAEHSSVFGVEGDDVPDAVTQAVNDVAIDAADRPVDVDAVDGEPLEAFDAPAADEGLLNREATVSGLADIERRTGASREEARVTAAIVADDLGDASRYYPVAAPHRTADPARWENVAKKISDLLGATAAAED